MLKFLHGFRKWTIMAVALVVSIVLLVMGYLSGEQFVDLHSVIVPAFMGTNVAEHIMKTTEKWFEKKLG